MFILGGVAFGQIVADPNDRLYTDLELWQNRGLISNLPPLRPYPLQLVKKVLSEVVERGNDADKELARMYLGQMGEGNHLHAVISSLGRTDLTAAMRRSASRAPCREAWSLPSHTRQLPG